MKMNKTTLEALLLTILVFVLVALVEGLGCIIYWTANNELPLWGGPISVGICFLLVWGSLFFVVSGEKEKNKDKK